MALPLNTGFTGVSFETFSPLTVNTGFSGLSFELAPIEKLKIEDGLSKATFIDVNSTRIEKDSVILANSENIIAKTV